MIVLQILFGVLATIIVMAYSRRREYRADAGQLKAFGIHDGGMHDVMSRLFMSHPPLEKRIAALEALGGMR